MTYEEKYRELRNFVLASANVDLSIDLTAFQGGELHNLTVKRIYKDLVSKIKELEEK